MSGRGEHFIAEATHNFVARDSDELSLVRNQRLRVAPKELQPPALPPGWLLACTIDSSCSRQGLVPANHINVLGRKRRVDPDVVQSTSSQSVDPELWNKKMEATDTFEKHFK